MTARVINYPSRKPGRTWHRVGHWPVTLRFLVLGVPWSSSLVLALREGDALPVLAFNLINLLVMAALGYSIWRMR